MKIILFFFFAIVVFSSCQKTVTVDIPRKAPRLVINAILEKNQPIEIMVGKSRHILDSSSWSVEPYVVKNALAIIFENGIPYDTLVYQPANYMYKTSRNKMIR